MKSNVLNSVRVMAISICIFIGIVYVIKPKSTASKIDEIQQATLIKAPTALSSFQLTDTEGRTFTEKSLKGHWTLMFFGYMCCPDICPATLNLVKDLWREYPYPVQPPARFIFANITPNVDPNTSLKPFLKNYHHDFVGIVGSDDAMKQLSQQLGIYVEKSKGSEGELAIVDHTTSLMLINPQGKLHAVFSPPLDPKVMKQDLEKLIKLL